MGQQSLLPIRRPSTQQFLHIVCQSWTWICRHVSCSPPKSIRAHYRPWAVEKEFLLTAWPSWQLWKKLRSGPWVVTALSKHSCRGPMSLHVCTSEWSWSADQDWLMKGLQKGCEWWFCPFFSSSKNTFIWFSSTPFGGFRIMLTIIHPSVRHSWVCCERERSPLTVKRSFYTCHCSFSTVACSKPMMEPRGKAQYSALLTKKETHQEVQCIQLQSEPMILISRWKLMTQMGMFTFALKGELILKR